MSKITNDRIKKHIKDPSNCHCSYRSFEGFEDRAVARCNESHEVRARIHWQLIDCCYKMVMKIPVGEPIRIDIMISDSDEVIDAKITAMFVMMDNAWRN